MTVLLHCIVHNIIKTSLVLDLFVKINTNIFQYLTSWEPCSSVGIATCYGLDGPGIESRWWRDFPHLSRPALGPTHPPTQCVLFLFPWGKSARAWNLPPTPSRDEVKERVEIFLISPSGSSWPVLGWPLPLPLLYINLLNADLNPICHLLTLLGAHLILHVSGWRVKLL